MAIDRQGIIDATYEGVGRVQPAGAGRAQGVVAADRPARRGREVLQARPRRGQAAARRGRLSRTASRPRMCFTHLRLARSLVDTAAARPQEPQGRRHRRQARPEGVRRLHRDLLLRQVRLDGLRAADAVPRARQLPLRPVLPGRARRTRATSTTRWWPTCSSASGARSTSAKRREVIHEIQRYLAKQQYYVQIAVGASTSRCGRARSRTTRPNLGYDYGGRLMAAWLDR